MKFTIKKLQGALVLAVLLVLPLLQMPTVRSLELTTEEQALSFIEDVLLLDLTKYNVTVKTGFENYSTHYGVVLPLGSARCDLESKESKLLLMFTFENYTLTSCHFYIVEGSPLFIQPQPINLLERVDVFLQRYQNYLGASDCQEMRSTLTTVSEVENMTTTVKNVRFELKVKSSSTQFRWTQTFNGADYTSLGMSFRSNGDFAFGDTRHVYEIGSTDVNISREEAISIAREQAKNLPWKATMGDETIEVWNYTIVDEPVGAGLYTMCREPFVLYPYWSVSLYFDKVYPGNVIGFTFEIWADTGEIINGRLNTLLGGFPPETPSETTPSTVSPAGIPPDDFSDPTDPAGVSPPVDEPLPESSPSNPNPEGNASSPLNTWLIAVAAVATGVAVAVTTVGFKKIRRNK